LAAKNLPEQHTGAFDIAGKCGVADCLFRSFKSSNFFRHYLSLLAQF